MIATLQRHLLALLLVESLGLYALALLLGFNPAIAVGASSVLALLAALLLERHLPYRNAWQKDHGDTATDLASAAVLIGIADPVAKAVIPLGAAWLYATPGVTSNLAAAPLVWQILVVLFVAELGMYWSHRLHHVVPALWWLHAMHHGSERLYVVNGLRFHPVNYWVNFTLAMLPVLALGPSHEAVLGWLAIAQPVVLIQHANIDLRFGWLNRVFSTPEAHRWHHSTVPAEANRNFGNALLLWDHVFRTFSPAEGFTRQQRIGLFASSQAVYPARKGYLCQLASMFRPRCCTG